MAAAAANSSARERYSCRLHRRLTRVLAESCYATTLARARKAYHTLLAFYVNINKNKSEMATCAQVNFANVTSEIRVVFFALSFCLSLGATKIFVLLHRIMLLPVFIYVINTGKSIIL